MQRPVPAAAAAVAAQETHQTHAQRLSVTCADSDLIRSTRLVSSRSRAASRCSAGLASSSFLSLMQRCRVSRCQEVPGMGGMPSRSARAERKPGIWRAGCQRSGRVKECFVSTCTDGGGAWQSLWAVAPMRPPDAVWPARHPHVEGREPVSLVQYLTPSSTRPLLETFAQSMALRARAAGARRGLQCIPPCPSRVCPPRLTCHLRGRHTNCP